jgi:BolA protein
VYREVPDLMQNGPLHALAMHLYTPDEWREKDGEAPASPDCLGGSKADAESAP